MTPARRLEGVRAYDRAADAFGAVARKPSPAPRLDSPAVVEPVTPELSVGDMVRAIPGWAVVVGGGVVAALLGVMLGGALHI